MERGRLQMMARQGEIHSTCSMPLLIEFKRKHDLDNKIHMAGPPCEFVFTSSDMYVNIELISS